MVDYDAMGIEALEREIDRLERERLRVVRELDAARTAEHRKLTEMLDRREAAHARK